MNDKKKWEELTAYDILARAASDWPDRVGLVTPRQRLTYSELLDHVHNLAYGLLDAGIGPSDIVATLFGTRGEWVILHYAIACIGAIIVPLNTRWQGEELRFALSKVGAKALITMDRDGNQEFLPRIYEACPELVDAHYGAAESITLPNLQLVVCFSPDAIQYENLMDFNELVKPAAEVDYKVLRRHASSVHPEDVATILFTSGSTGFPKAAMLTHRCLVGQAYHLSLINCLEPDDRFVNIMPIFHCGGFVSGIMQNHYACDTLCLVDTFTAEEVLQVVTNERITFLLGFPTIINRMLDLAERERADLSSLRKGHIPHPKTWDRVVRETNITYLTTLYGLTEAGGIVTMTPLEESDPAKRRDTHGAPLPGITVRIVDPETKEVLKVGLAGEITFKGWNRFAGYFGDSDLTASTIDEEGYCFTGDRGLIDEDGYLIFLGRYKEIVKTGGENVSQLEVERFLELNIPGVSAVCVVGVPDPIWDEAVTAIIEPEPGVVLNLDEVRTSIKGRIANFKIPKHILFMSPGGWPLVGSSKVNKRSLRAWAMQELGISEK